MRKGNSPLPKIVENPYRILPNENLGIVESKWDFSRIRLTSYVVYIARRYDWLFFWLGLWGVLLHIALGVDLYGTVWYAILQPGVIVATDLFFLIYLALRTSYAKQGWVQSDSNIAMFVALSLMVQLLLLLCLAPIFLYILVRCVVLISYVLGWVALSPEDYQYWITDPFN